MSDGPSYLGNVESLRVQPTNDDAKKRLLSEEQLLCEGRVEPQFGAIPKYEDDDSSDDDVRVRCPKDERDWLRLTRYPAFALALAILSAGFGALATVTAVQTATRMTAAEKLFYRFVVQVIVAFVMNVIVKKPLIPSSKSRLYLLTMRTIAATASLVCFLSALETASVGNVAAIFYSAPAVTLIAGCLLGSDVCGIVETVGAFVAVIGVVFIARPNGLFLDLPSHDYRAFDNRTMYHVRAADTTNNSFVLVLNPLTTVSPNLSRDASVGAILAVLAAVFASFDLIGLRRPHCLPVGTVVFTCGLVGTVITLGGVLLGDEELFVTLPRHWHDVALLLVAGSLQTVEQACLVHACRVVPAVDVAVARSIQCLWLFYPEVTTAPVSASVLGAVYIVGAVVLLALKVSLCRRVRVHYALRENPCELRFISCRK